MWKNGLCVDAQGKDVSKGVLKIKNVANEYSRYVENDCLHSCLSYTKAKVTGCEYIWKQSNRGCYIHTLSIVKGNGLANHKCTFIAQYSMYKFY